MTGLAEFLAARLDEDEAAARAATPGPWAAGGLPWASRDIVHAPDYRPEGFSKGQNVAECIVADGGMGPWAADVRGSGFPQGNATHIARHDPARVLAEVAAGRLLLVEYANAKLAYQQASSMCIDTRDRISVAKYDAAVAATYAAWRAIQRVAFAKATVYSGHADYDPAWAPEGATP